MTASEIAAAVRIYHANLKVDYGYGDQSRRFVDQLARDYHKALLKYLDSLP